jgi:RNA polymerase sigma-70 factor (ECF subfamily)
MWKKPQPAAPAVNYSKEGTSDPEPSSGEPQLSDRDGVNSDVSSVALNYGLPAVGTRSQAAVASANGGEQTDAEVMLRVKAGDDSAFDFLVQKYRRPIINFMYRMAHNSAAAEDLAQEVFLRVYRARADYVPSAKFTTWLFRIATNLALNSMRDHRYERMEVSLDAPITADAEDGDERPLDVADQHPDIEQHLVEDVRRKMIRHAIEKLPEKQRAAVLLHKYQELDYGEIAKILSCSESALKSLLFRAYEALRVELAPLVAQHARGGTG